VLAHEFVLVQDISNYDTSKIYPADFDSSDLVIISDEFILKHHDPLALIEMYSGYDGRRIRGLDYYSVTVLDPEMAANLRTAMLELKSRSKDYKKLMKLLDQAVKDNLYIIHFGI
jgi:hypothetical protein